MKGAPTVAIVHDYLTQRGGAERVVLSMLKAFPGAPVYTSLYDPAGTYPEFRREDVRPLWLNRIVPLRTRHRLALPMLAFAFSRLTVDADVVLCSSSGWAHGARTNGCKVVYCHSPARWLYQTARYLDRGSLLTRLSSGLLRTCLVPWDRCAAASAAFYLANSCAVSDRIRVAYGIDAEVVPPPYSLDPAGEQRPVAGIEPGYFLCVSRLLAYKNVGAVVAAFARLPGERLVVVGSGPEERRLQTTAGRNVRFAGAVADAELRWLYAHSQGIVAASYEDFGLTPIEGAAFGKPAAVLRWGGFLDTVLQDRTGVFFEQPGPREIAAAVQRLASLHLSPDALTGHAAQYSEAAFALRLRSAVARCPGSPVVSV